MITWNSVETFLANHPLHFLIQKFVDMPVLVKWAKIPRKPSLLQVGLSNSRIAHFLAATLKPKQFYAVDPEAQNIARSEGLSTTGSSIIFEVANPNRLPFPKETFDAVVSVNFLHRLVNWKKAINEISRVLKKGGQLLLRDFSVETFHYPLVGIAMRRLLDRPYDHMFNQHELLCHLRHAGFSVTHQYDSSWMIIMVAEKTK